MKRMVAGGLEMDLTAAHADHTDRVVVGPGSLVVPRRIGSVAAESLECVVAGAHKGSAVPV